MRSALIALTLIAAPGPALAQYLPPMPFTPAPPAPSAYTPNYAGSAYRAPSTTTAYDPNTGNQYRTTTQPGGQTTTHGTNAQTGSNWSSTTSPSGYTTGVDASGNRWTYNPSTGAYINSGTGVVCTGTGAYRVCSGN